MLAYQLFGYLYINGMWLNVEIKRDTNKTYVEKRSDYVLKIILDSMINMIWGVGPIWPLNENKNPHFDNAFICTLKIMWQKVVGMISLANHLALRYVGVIWFRFLIKPLR